LTRLPQQTAERRAGDGLRHDVGSEAAVVALDHGETGARDVDTFIDGESLEDARARDLEPRAGLRRAHVAHGAHLLDDPGEHG